MWIYSPLYKRWYSPEDFRHIFTYANTSEDFLNQLQIKHPNEGIEAGFKRLMEMQNKLQALINLVWNTIKNKVQVDNKNFINILEIEKEFIFCTLSVKNKKRIYMKRCFRVVRLLILFFALLSFGCSNYRGVRTGSSTFPLLTGEWVVSEQTVSPLSIIPLCKPIFRGTTFKFTRNNLAIYINALQNPCDTFRYKIAGNTISFIKEDMIWLCSHELNKNILKLKSNNFFTSVESDKPLQVNKQLTTAQEIVVTLIKKNN
jgi:hypothetical protein